MSAIFFNCFLLNGKCSIAVGTLYFITIKIVLYRHTGRKFESHWIGRIKLHRNELLHREWKQNDVLFLGCSFFYLFFSSTVQFVISVVYFWLFFIFSVNCLTAFERIDGAVYFLTSFSFSLFPSLSISRTTRLLIYPCSIWCSISGFNCRSSLIPINERSIFRCTCWFFDGVWYHYRIVIFGSRGPVLSYRNLIRRYRNSVCDSFTNKRQLSMERNELVEGIESFRSYLYTVRHLWVSAVDVILRHSWLPSFICGHSVSCVVTEASTPYYLWCNMRRIQANVLQFQWRI